MSLIDKLLSSANLPTQEDIDQAWSKEVEKRCKEIEDGQAKLIPGDEVFVKIRFGFNF